MALRTRDKWIGIVILVATVGGGGFWLSRPGESPPHNAAGPSQQAGPGPIRMEDVSEARGLRFRWTPTSQRPLRILDTFGCGCAFLDFDGDGRPDIFLVGEPRCALFRQQPDGSFSDISASAGLNAFTSPEWKGCAVGDYDDDGRPDILLAGYRRLALLRNEQGRTLRDVTHAAGLPEDNRLHWGSSAGFMDLDADGDLDLVVLNYVIFNPSTPQLCELTAGVKSGCPPQTYQPELPTLYRNDGGKFVDVSRAAGFGRTHGKGLALAFADYDADGRIDMFIGNDGTPADLMKNLGGLRFRNAGDESGAAFGVVPGQPIAAMGVDWADFDRDGRPDFAVSAFENEAYSLQHNDGDGFFRNESSEAGLVDATFRPLGFGTNFVDVDNDGYPDLFFANGHVYDNVDRIYKGSTFLQPMMLFHNANGRRFQNLAPALGGAWTRPIMGRGSARGDFDRDGRMDLLVVDYQGAPLLLQNRSETGNHWLSVTAAGRTRNRLGYGVRVEARAGSSRWVDMISPSASYLSTSDPMVHFGLGTTAHLDELIVTWPGGKSAKLHDLSVDRLVAVQEPS